MAQKRKSNGEGTIRKRGDRFEARLTMPDGSRPSVYGASRREVQNKLRDLQDLRAQGRSIGTADQKVSDYLDRWLSTALRTKQFGVTSALTYRSCIRRAVPYIGTYKMGQLRATHIDEAYAALLDKGLSTRTVQHTHTTLKQAFKKAVLHDQLLANPFDRVSPPSVIKRQMHPFTGEELRSFWTTTTENAYYPIWVLLGTTGMRVGEALALRWYNVTPTTVSVLKTMRSEPGKGAVLGKTKNEASERTIDITPYCYDTLMALKGTQTIRVLDREKDFVFRRHHGRPWSYSAVCRAFHRMTERAGLPHIRLHDLRHTYATLLLEQQVPVVKVAQTMGHANPAITHRVYSHVTRVMDDAAVEAMERIITGPSARLREGEK